MPEANLRRTAEHLWNAWMDLNYAVADLAADGAPASIRSEIGSRAADLRTLAEELERLAAIETAVAPRRQRIRRPPAS